MCRVTGTLHRRRAGRYLLRLDGSIRLGTLIDLAKATGVELPSETEQGLLDLVAAVEMRIPLDAGGRPPAGGQA